MIHELQVGVKQTGAKNPRLIKCMCDYQRIRLTTDHAGYSTHEQSHFLR